MPLVSDSEAATAAMELRLHMMASRVPHNRLRDALFGQCESTDGISSFELARALGRKPILFAHAETAGKIARYLVEPRDKAEVVQNDLLEESVRSVSARFDALVSPYKMLPAAETETTRQTIGAVLLYRDLVETGESCRGTL